MPLVRIDLGAGHEAGFGEKVGEIVHHAMREEINVPADDKFQIITSHAVSELVFPKSYLGVEYSQGIIFIQITLNEGRTTELKKHFYKRIATDCAQQLGVREQDIFISLIEVNKENWSFGNGEMQYGPVV